VHCLRCRFLKKKRSRGMTGYTIGFRSVCQFITSLQLACHTCSLCSVHTRANPPTAWGAVLSSGQPAHRHTYLPTAECRLRPVWRVRDTRYRSIETSSACPPCPAHAILPLRALVTLLSAGSNLPHPNLTEFKE
jgi:hypothetical protein